MWPRHTYHMGMGMGTGLPALPQPPWGAAAKVLHGAPAAGCTSTLPWTDPHLGLEGSLGQGEVISGSSARENFWK